VVDAYFQSRSLFYSANKQMMTVHQHIAWWCHVCTRGWCILQTYL